MEYAVVLESVSKSFGRIHAVRNLNLKIEGGTVYGLLGPNGSGKSTTMKMVMGLVKPDSGRICVYGIDVQRDPIKVKKILDYVPKTPCLYEFLMGLGYLDFIADIYGMDRHSSLYSSD